jgi:hypothetical protein
MGKPSRLIQQLAGGDPSGGDDACKLSAVAEELSRAMRAAGIVNMRAAESGRV